MGWLKVETRSRNKSKSTLKFICDSPANSWGAACGDMNVEEFVADSFEACFLEAKERGWCLTETEIPMNASEMGNALCPNCAVVWDFE